MSRELLVEFNMACAPAHLAPSKPQRRIPQITHLAPVELEQVPGVPHCRIRIRYLVVTSIDGALHSSRTCGHPLDLWRRIAEQQVSLTLIPSLDRLPHDLQVRLRHRLLLKAEVGERAFAVGVCDEPRHSAFVDVEQGCSLFPHRPKLQTACLATPGEAREHQDASAVEFAVLVRLRAESLPRA